MHLGCKPVYTRLSDAGVFMSLSKIMTSKLVSVEPDDSLEEIKRLFDNVPFHHLLVVEKGKLVGIVSDRDLFKALSPAVGTAAETRRDAALLHKKAHQIMTRKPTSLSPQQTIKDALDLFNSQRFSCIPIVDKHNKPVGVVSWRDIMRALANSWPANK